MHDHDIAAKVAHLTPEELELYRMRHSLAHALAAAVTRLVPGVELGFGPPVDDGFYYDFLLPEPLSGDDLARVEEEMRAFLAADHELHREVLPWAEARARVEGMGQRFKLELLEDLRARGVSAVSFYRCGPFLDVCEGPHVERTSRIPADAFALSHVAGAYWKGSEANPMLTRVYGLAFRTRSELDAHRRLLAEAARRDHRRLGAELDLFHIDDEVGKGLPLWLPAGTVLRDELEKLAREAEFLDGYQRVATPEVAREELFVRSGHLPYYRDTMFPPMELEEEGGEGGAARRQRFYLKPMNCPFHHLIFRARPRSYRDLPLRLAEHGHVYRFERSGVLSGLLRVRGMTMNDAHLYVAPEQAKEEFKRVLELHLRHYRLLHLDSYWMRLSLSSPDSGKFLPYPELWAAAERLCVEAMEELGLPYEAVPGEAAFYGPKIDVQVKNVIGREETASTCQVDPMAALEERFDLTYAGADGQRHRPWVIHRAPLGTHERFIAFLIEHFAGAFPLWLAPVQVRVLPVGDDARAYAHSLGDELHRQMVRAEVDDSNDSLARRVRAGTVRKVPLLAVVGAREVADGSVTVRRYQDQERRETIPREAFLATVLREIRERVTPRPRV